MKLNCIWITYLKYIKYKLRFHVYLLFLKIHIFHQILVLFFTLKDYALFKYSISKTIIVFN